MIFDRHYQIEVHGELKYSEKAMTEKALKMLVLTSMLSC